MLGARLGVSQMDRVRDEEVIKSWKITGICEESGSDTSEMVWTRGENG